MYSLDRQDRTDTCGPGKEWSHMEISPLWWGMGCLGMGSQTVWSSLEPAHHVHMCMNTSNWLGRKGCLGCREATRASGAAGSWTEKQCEDRVIGNGSAPHWPGQWAMEEKADLLNKPRLRCDRVWRWTSGWPHVNSAVPVSIYFMPILMLPCCFSPLPLQFEYVLFVAFIVKFTYNDLLHKAVGTDFPQARCTLNKVSIHYHPNQ